MEAIETKSAEEAPTQWADLLEAAEHGGSTIITRRGKPVAALIPVEAFAAATSQRSALKLKGSGRGLWGATPGQIIADAREEWDR